MILSPENKSSKHLTRSREGAKKIIYAWFSQMTGNDRSIQ